VAATNYPQAITPADHVAPVPRRIRAMLGGRTVLDTTRALYLWEWPPYPQYLIPAADVDPEVLVDTGETRRRKRGTVTKVGLRVGDVERPAAGERYDESPIAGLPGMIRFAWDTFDAWFEEDEEIYVHPRNPYARVDALRSSRTIRVELDGVVLAQSSSPVLVFETGLPMRSYLDRTAVDFRHLRPSATQTACPYKGRTSDYWSVEIGGQLHPDLAWSYAFPTRQLQPIAGLIAFYDEKVDVYIDDQLQARPQTHFS
jgi:uncharacterized protein (DUF427 family)